MNKLSSNFQEHEAWVVGRVMSMEKTNREAMYWVLKLIRFTIEPMCFVSKPKGYFLVKFSNLEDRTRNFNVSLLEIRKGKAKANEEALDYGSLTDRRLKRVPKKGGSRVRSKRKKIRGYSGEGEEESPIRLVRRKLSDGVLPFKETKARSREMKRVALLSKNEAKITIKNFSNHHINSLVSVDGMDCFRFTSFYGFAYLNYRDQSWELLRRVVAMEKFGKAMDELALIDIKPDKGWFMWSNIRDGSSIVKERLDRFMVSAYKDPRLFFKYFACWAKDKDAKNLHSWFNRLRSCMHHLIERIDILVDGPNVMSNTEMLRTS
ncbi:hypothetical protein Goshw_007176, partial [Gossypium schwendimanii]|nr:hypothetical protein [Gossypium schwendimanii]